MLGAALGAARPMALEADRLTVAFPSDAAFVKKKAEARPRARAAARCAGSPGTPLAVDLRAARRVVPAAEAGYSRRGSS